MNKEHFLIELKLHLRQLSLVDQQAILAKYEELFETKTAEGLTEYQVTKELASPKEIAISILKEFNLEFQETKGPGNDWIEFSTMETQTPEVDGYHPYHEAYDIGRKPDSGFIRFFQITGVALLNLFFMIWLIFGWALTLFMGWILTLTFVASPLIGAYSFITLANSYGMFQLSMSILFCGAGLIGLLIMVPFSKVSFNLLKTYSRWNLQVLKGERAL
ncbi:DUF1700 domain-containing protein [Vagococcus carniphilus]|uniref:DUF1700 domain-containing protein n=1 Tax=Vagococcus carniphilus TaxID=218144 RepID=UPI00288E64BE|nr:DUF1700 domain-containing protein [Vagococcus carniphilus]MDT2865369.1 DUF1700 domain-containing protein [Vagococcus carniphilus]